MIIDPYIIFEQGIIKQIDPKQIAQNGIDCTLDKLYLVCGNGSITKDKTQLPSIVQKQPDKKTMMFTLLPQRLYQFHCNEIVNIPKGMCATLVNRSSLSRCGCNVFSGLYDSGFKGKVGGTMRVIHPIEIEHGSRILQMVFMQSEGKVLYDGQFQGEGL